MAWAARQVPLARSTVAEAARRYQGDSDSRASRRHACRTDCQRCASSVLPARFRRSRPCTGTSHPWSPDGLSLRTQLARARSRYGRRHLDDPHAGSHFQMGEPVFSHLIASPLPATPTMPWSESRQNSPGS